MNYMVLSSLHKIYAKEPGPHQARAQDLYQRLRKNIIENVYKVRLLLRVIVLFAQAHTRNMSERATSGSNMML